LAVLFFLLGLLLLVAGGELLVRGASRLALSFGISPLVVGLTVVAFGTSSPELAVSVQSAWSGQTDIALGNVVGSNIFNVLFILGASALITPLAVARQLVWQEVPVMIGISLLLFALALDGGIDRGEAALLAAMLLGYTVFLIRQSRAAGQNPGELPAPAGKGGGWKGHWLAQAGLIAAGLGLLVQGSQLLVEAAVGFALHLGVSEMVIGLTIVAAGTSLPEVATSLMAALRGERDIAVGNAVGSNIFNILGVLGFAGLVAPAGLAVPAAMLTFDLPVMIAVAAACLPVFFTGHLIARWEGVLFLGYYVAYTVYLILAAREHDALDSYALAMGAVVLPLTAVTLAVLAFRHWRAPRIAGKPSAQTKGPLPK
jgi:cation:H+ antiporter